MNALSSFVGFLSRNWVRIAISCVAIGLCLCFAAGCNSVMEHLIMIK